MTGTGEVNKEGSWGLWEPVAGVPDAVRGVRERGSLRKGHSNWELEDEYKVVEKRENGGNSRLEKQHAQDGGKSFATFHTYGSTLNPSATRHSGGKYTKGKPHFRSFLEVQIYIGNLFVLQEPLTFPLPCSLPTLNYLTEPPLPVWTPNTSSREEALMDVPQFSFIAWLNLS